MASGAWRELADHLAHDRGDIGIAEELGGRAVGEHLAGGERHDAARILRDQVHVVLDEDDRLHPARFAASTTFLIMPCLSPLETPLVGSSSRITSGDSAKGAAMSSSFFALREKPRLVVELALEPEDPPSRTLRAQGLVLAPGEQVEALARLPR